MPSSPFGRVMGFAQLGASLVYGTMSDSVSQYFSLKSTEPDTEKPSNRCATLPLPQMLDKVSIIMMGPQQSLTFCAMLLLAILQMRSQKLVYNEKLDFALLCSLSFRHSRTDIAIMGIVNGALSFLVYSHACGQCRYITERNAERLADALCRMRGAALKLGQMISIQDENVLPPAVSPWYPASRTDVWTAAVDAYHF